MLRDALRHVTRALSAEHNRSYVLATLASFALGIGAATAIASIAYALLIAPLPYRDGEQVLRVFERHPARGIGDFAVSLPNFQSWQERADSFESMAALRVASINLGIDDSYARIAAIEITDAFWRVLGLAPIAGRDFSAEEHSGSGSTVAILGERLWRERFAADPAVIGRTLIIDGSPHSVIGVAPADVGFSTDVGLWLPLAPRMEADLRADRDDRRLDVLARLAAGRSASEARAQLALISGDLATGFPDSNRGWEAGVQSVRDWIVGAGARERVEMLLAAAAVLLLVACINVASLQLARASSRRREFGVREALGAGRVRLLLHWLLEHLVLTLVGAVLGVALALLALDLTVSLLPPTAPRLSTIALRPELAAGATALALLIAIGAGVAPLLGSLRGQLVAILRAQQVAGGDSGRARARKALVAAQFGFAAVLAIVALALAQKLAALLATDAGFRPEHILSARLTLPEVQTGAEHERQLEIYGALIDAIAALPGVESVGLTNEIPLGEFNTSFTIAPAGAPPEAALQSSWRIVSSNYLATLGVPLLRGRGFDSQRESARSLLISESIAQRLWPDGTDPIGREVMLGNGQRRTVIGVVGDVRQVGLGEPVTPTMYMPPSWWLWPTMTLVLRSEGDPAVLIAPLTRIASRIAPQYPLFDVRTLGSVIAASVAQPRLQTLVLVVFALASLLLAAVGIAGVIAFVVAQRRAELAVRLALGAAPRRLVSGVVRQGLGLSVLGMALGIALLLAGAERIGLSASFVELAPIVAVASALLLLIAGFACWLPARAAGRVAPSLALRGE